MSATLMEHSVADWPYSVPPSDVVVQVTYEGVPLSKARPRFTRSGAVYTPRQTRDYEDDIALLIRASLNGRSVDAQGKYALRCIFYRPDRHRIDCDNLLKAVSDAATGQVWKDDSQVVEVIGRLVAASDHARAEILIHRADDPAPRPTCPMCGNEVTTYPSVGTVHCSAECYSKSTYVTQECRGCGVAFSLPRCYAKRRAGFCSLPCSLAYYGRMKTAKSGPPTWKCQDCGGPVTRKEYVRCRACSMKTRSDPTWDYWQLRHAKGLAK
jgi:Holliday junction resolvase RusA-like endonuclease